MGRQVNTLRCSSRRASLSQLSDPSRCDSEFITGGLGPHLQTRRARRQDQQERGSFTARLKLGDAHEV